MNKDDLISLILTSGLYLEDKDYSEFSRDDKVLDALVERFSRDLMKRQVVSNPLVVRLSCKNIGGAIRITYSQSDNFGWIITSSVVDEKYLFKGSLWNDLKYHDEKKTPPAKEVNTDECCTD